MFIRIKILRFLSDFSKVMKSLNRRRRVERKPRREATETDIFESGMNLRKLVGISSDQMIFLTDQSDDQTFNMNLKNARRELKTHGLLLGFNSNDSNGVNVLDELCSLHSNRKLIFHSLHLSSREFRDLHFDSIEPIPLTYYMVAQR